MRKRTARQRALSLPNWNLEIFRRSRLKGQPGVLQSAAGGGAAARNRLYRAVQSGAGAIVVGGREGLAALGRSLGRRRNAVPGSGTGCWWEARALAREEDANP